MTCIVGLKANGKVYIGGDSLGASGVDKVVRKDEKVFRNKDFVIGYTTSFRMGQLLRFMFVPPAITKTDDDLFKYMVTKFVEAARKTFIKGGFSQNKEGEDIGGEFLVAYKDRLFKIQSDFQVGESVGDYDACGCGERFALGALWANQWDILSPEERVFMALEAAEAHSAGVQRPFIIKDTGGKNGKNNFVG